MANKVIVKEKNDFSKEFPQKRAAKVTVRWKDSKEEAFYVEYPKGEPENPIEYMELLEKFMSLLKVSGISSDRADEIVTCVIEETDATVYKLMKLLTEF